MGKTLDISCLALGAQTTGDLLTDIQHISSTARVQAQWRIAGWAVLRLELLDVLVEAGLVRDVGAGELEDALAAQGVFERFIADGALASNEGPLPARTTSIGVQHTCHATATAGVVVVGLAVLVVCGGRRLVAASAAGRRCTVEPTRGVVVPWSD